MRPSLQKLRVIFANHLATFMGACVASAFVYAASAAVFSTFHINLARFTPVVQVEQLALLLVFIAPLILYFYSIASQALVGAKPIIPSIKHFRRQLFATLGVLWTSTGFLLVLIHEYPFIMLLLNLIFITLSWYVMVGLLVKYVRAL